MRRIFPAVAMLIISFAAAREAKACFDCCVPPPYTSAVCCSSICGATGCTATSGTSSFCTAEGSTCSSNDEYCSSGGGVQHKNDWVRCSPPLSKKWQLVAVRVTPAPSVKIARKS